jgi:hypothetical protein
MVLGSIHPLTQISTTIDLFQTERPPYTYTMRKLCNTLFGHSTIKVFHKFCCCLWCSHLRLANVQRRYIWCCFYYLMNKTKYTYKTIVVVCVLFVYNKKLYQKHISCCLVLLFLNNAKYTNNTNGCKLCCLRFFHFQQYKIYS